MNGQKPDFATFRECLLARMELWGTFVKLPTTQVIEILGEVGYDFVVIDQEHAPLDRATTDLMILAARASGVAPLVRVGSPTDAAILSALDCGAMGVLVPHVASVAKAQAVAQACRYAAGKRGFAGLTRASNWARVSGSEHMKRQDRQIACIAMIEDIAAVDLAEDIAGVEGIDALFIGRGDLTATFGDDVDASKKVAAITSHVAAAACKAGVPLMMLPTDEDDLIAVKELGASAMMISSDHGFIKSAADRALKNFAG